MKTEKYAEVKKINTNNWAVIDSANQFLFVTQSERKAKIFLKKVLQGSGL